MKNILRCSTVASLLSARSFIALSASLIALSALTPMLTGCGGGGGGGNPSPTPSTGASQTVITGRILDVNTGSVAVAGATVTFAGVSVQTDSNGNFSLTVPRNTASGTATITAPGGTTLYSYASSSAGCANSLAIRITGPLTSSTLAIGNVFVYSKTANSAPNPPCI
jgi:hypothetical protein